MKKNKWVTSSRPYLEYWVTATLLCSSLGLIVFKNYSLASLPFFLYQAYIASIKNKKMFVHFLWLFVAIWLVALSPISTVLTYKNFSTMGVMLSIALFAPFLINYFLDISNPIKYNFAFKQWKKYQYHYLLYTLFFAVTLVPFYLKQWPYLNWSVHKTFESIFLLFMGTNLLWLWDELFFINTIFSTLLEYVSFPVANLVQATLFCTFLFELWFDSWGPIFIFPFALSQGYIFYKSHSLWFVICIHLILDFILYLSLLSAHGIFSKTVIF